MSAVGARCGKAFKASGKWNVVANTHPLALDEEKIDWDYAWRLLNNENWWIKSGSGQPFVKVRESLKRNIYLPPLSVQKKFAANLERVEKQIALTKQSLADLDSLVKSRFIEMFGDIDDTPYEVKRIQDCCEKIKDGTHQTPTYVEKDSGGVFFLSSKNVVSGKVDWNSVRYIPEALHEELHKRVAPRKGDILLAKNGTTGVCAIVDKDCVFDIYVSLAHIRPLKGVDSIYLWAAINADKTKEQFNSRLKGIGVPNLHLKEIKETLIVLPPSPSNKSLLPSSLKSTN